MARLKRCRVNSVHADLWLGMSRGACLALHAPGRTCPHTALGGRPSLAHGAGYWDGHATCDIRLDDSGWANSSFNDMEAPFEATVPHSER